MCDKRIQREQILIFVAKVTFGRCPIPTVGLLAEAADGSRWLGPGHVHAGRVFQLP